MVELAAAWHKTNERLSERRRDLETLPARIDSERRQLGMGGRAAPVHAQNLAKAEQDLQRAQEEIPQLENQLRELQHEYTESGYDAYDYAEWTPGETRVGGRGIEQVGRAVAASGSPAGLTPTYDEITIAAAGGSIRQLGRAALRRATGKAPTVSAVNQRIAEVHGSLDSIAMSQRTTAILETSKGTRIVAGGGRDLSPAQRALLGSSDVAAKLPMAHAEITALEHAARNGLIPAKITASRPFCHDCIDAIEKAGGRITSPTTAIFPR